MDLLNIFLDKYRNFKKSDTHIKERVSQITNNVTQASLTEKNIQISGKKIFFINIPTGLRIKIYENKNTILLLFKEDGVLSRYTF